MSKAHFTCPTTNATNATAHFTQKFKDPSSIVTRSANVSMTVGSNHHKQYMQRLQNLLHVRLTRQRNEALRNPIFPYCKTPVAMECSTGGMEMRPYAPATLATYHAIMHQSVAFAGPRREIPMAHRRGAGEEGKKKKRRRFHTMAAAMALQGRPRPTFIAPLGRVAAAAAAGRTALGGGAGGLVGCPSAWAPVSPVVGAGVMGPVSRAVMALPKALLATMASPVVSTHDVGATDDVAPSDSEPSLHPLRRATGYWLLGFSGLVFGMVVLGGLTRLTESGLSMHDWSLLHYQPPRQEDEWQAYFDTYKTFPEYQLYERHVGRIKIS